MTLEELANFIKTRRSIRRWQDKPVPESLLMQAVELATWAPNAGNQQSWRFYVIVNRNTIKAIADAVQASIDQVASWPEAETFAADVAKWRQTAVFFRTAPAAIAVATGRYQVVADRILALREKVDAEAARIREWRNTASSRTQTIGAAVAYLLLVLHQMGLGAVWMTGPMQAKGQIEKILKTPPEMDIVTFVPVGYPAESPTKTRKPVSEVSEVVR